MADVKGVLQKLFPFISMAASLGGPLGTMAASAVGTALGVNKVDPTPDGIAAAVAGATPDQIIALKKADQDFQVQMESMGVKLEELSNDDRASARTMQVQTRSWVVPTIGCIFVGGFFLITALKLFKVIPAGDPTTNDLITTLRDGLMLILAYYYGSSKGSADKDQLLANSVPASSVKGN